MTTTDDDDDDHLFRPPPTPEEDMQFVREKLDLLGFTLNELAMRLRELGDGRGQNAVARSIRRAAAGETRLSPELRVLLIMLERDWRRAATIAAKATWTPQSSGTFYTSAREFDIYLIRQTKGRWKVHMAHEKTKYSPSWIGWQDSLEAAKIRAFVQLDDTCLDEGIGWNIAPDK